MTRRRSTANPSLWAPGEERENRLDSMFDTMRDRAQHELGHEVLVGSEAERLVVGLPLPALCLRYLFQSTVLPLSRIIQITGEEGCCKSALLFEIMRWHMVHGGGGVYIENEDKDSPELRQSILDWNERWLRRLEFTKTYDLESWQAALTKFVMLLREQQSAEGGPGHTIPVCLGIDSIMSTAPRSEIEAMRESGHAQRGYALAAQLITRYMRGMPELLQCFPFTVVGINHLKPSTDYMGRPTNTKPGGMAVKFHETFELEMHRAPTPDIDLLEYGGLRLKITSRKNSIGPSRKSIGAEMLWWQGDVRGVIRQQTAWDWDTATIELLLSFENAKGKKTIYNRLMEIIDLRVANKSRREVWSSVLGIPQNAPVHYRQAGAMLEQRVDLLERIYPILAITPRYPFTPGVDYRTAMAESREHGVAASASVYHQVEAMPIVDPAALDPTGATIPPEVPSDEFSDEDEELQNESAAS